MYLDHAVLAAGTYRSLLEHRVFVLQTATFSYISSYTYAGRVCPQHAPGKHASASMNREAGTPSMYFKPLQPRVSRVLAFGRSWPRTRAGETR